MSPWTAGGGYSFGLIVGASNSDSGVLDDRHLGNSLGVRPVISLKSCVQWDEGNGTTAEPYKVKINENCTSVEN